MKYSKRIIKHAFRMLGLEVHRYSADASPTVQLMSVLKEFGIDMTFDIGANKGQFANEIRNGGYRGDIVSFEPLSAAHTSLTLAAENDSKWKVHPRCALGDYDGEIKINISSNSVSSSILPILTTHTTASPLSSYCGQEVANIWKLDTIAEQYCIDGRNLFLKIDTQGYEWRVLDGAKETMPYVNCIMIELSLSELYKGQHLWRETIDRLEGEGFFLWSLLPGFKDPQSGQTYQVDGIFTKRP